MNPKLSIIIPTYNRANFIRSTIDSVLDQTYQNFELIIVDDGSIDNTQEVISSIKDHRILYSKKKNEERAVARNFGIRKSSGQYITFLDSDDILYPKHLEEAYNLIYGSDYPEWLHLGYEIKDEKGEIIRKENKRKGDINNTLITGNHLSCIGVFVRHDIMNENKFNEDIEIIGSEDYELWLRLASKYTLRYSNTVTACIIQHRDRSVISSFDDYKLIKRINKLVEIVQQANLYRDQEFKKFLCHRYLYLSLHLALNKSKLESLRFLWKALKTSTSIFFNKKFWAIIKNLP